MSPDISIIIVNYATPEITQQCLECVLEIDVTGLNVHVIVVDNGSPVDYELPKKFQNSRKIQFDLMRSESNLGFTGGNNMGIHAAIERYNSDYVLLLNNDTIVPPSLLQDLIAHAQQHPDQGVISPKIYFAKGKEFFQNDYSRGERGKVIWYAGGSIDWQNLDSFHRNVDEVDRGQAANDLTSDFATGCCLLIRREVLEKIGLLDKKFFLYYEDTDWSMKARQAGYQIGYCDTAYLWHINAGSSQGAGSSTHEYYQTRNRLLFFWRYGSMRTRLTVLSLASRFAVKGARLQKLAAWHFLTGKRGKQPLS